jgi:hypothetical protein
MRNLAEAVALETYGTEARVEYIDAALLNNLFV